MPDGVGEVAGFPQLLPYDPNLSVALQTQRQFSNFGVLFSRLQSQSLFNSEIVFQIGETLKSVDSSLKSIDDTLSQLSEKFGPSRTPPTEPTT